jgi:putative tryptophan/tyrosine transport system substrate-binding protein
MDRRAFLGVLALLAAPRAAEAQPAERTARVGILASSSEEAFASSVAVFRQALHELGWVKGRNLALEVRYADAYPQLPVLAAELVRLNVDIIFTMGSPATRAAKQTTTTVPIVMETLGDAVSAGLVSNLARPGGNVTGTSGFAPELSGKQLELIREMVPRASRVALLANSDNAATPVVLRATETAAARLAIRLEAVKVRKPSELDAAFETQARSHAEALLVVTDPLFSSQRRRIVALAARHRIPAAYWSRVFPEAGGLLSYGQLRGERFRRAAAYVDRILKGAKPGDLPVEQPTQFELVINLRTAKALGLAMPPSLLQRADQVIE